MQDIKTREQYDSAIQEVVGLELATVTYYEIKYEVSGPYYLHHPGIGHFLDFGVEFRMACGQYRSFFWDGTFYQYGIGPYPQKATLELTGTNSKWDVSERKEWKELIGCRIESAEVFWSWASHSDAPRKSQRIYYPQDIKLSFAGGKCIYISASQYLEETDTLFGMSDDILIVFEESVARNYGIGPYADDS